MDEQFPSSQWQPDQDAWEGKHLGKAWEKEFNHMKKRSLVRLGRGNLFKIIVQKQISSTGIILNNKIDLIPCSEDTEQEC